MADGAQITLRKEAATYKGEVEGKDNFLRGGRLELGEEQFRRLWAAARGCRLEKIGYMVRQGTRKVHINSYIGVGEELTTAEINLSHGAEFDRSGWELKPIKGNPLYHTLALIARANQAPSTFEAVRKSNGAVVMGLLGEAAQSYGGALSADQLQLDTFRHIFDSLKPVYTAFTEQDKNPVGEIARCRVFANPGSRNELQRKYGELSDDTIRALRDDTIRIATVKQEDHYISHGSIGEDGAEEKIRIRKQGSDRVILSYRLTRAEGAYSFSFEIDKETGDQLAAIYFKDPVVVLKDRDFLLSRHNLLVTYDRLVSKVQVKMDGGSPVIKPLGSILEVKLPRNNRAEEERTRRFARDLRLGEPMKDMGYDRM